MASLAALILVLVAGTGKYVVDLREQRQEALLARQEAVALSERLELEAQRVAREAASVRAVSDFLVDLFEVSDRSAGRGSTSSTKTD